jgi:DNA-binding beta-propeller fold protein YncE
MAIDPSGSKVYVTGPSNGAAYNDYATVAFDTTDGSALWVARYNDPQRVGDTPFDIAVAPDGSRVYVTGCLGTFDDCVIADYFTIAYDATSGRQVWTARYEDPVGGYDIATSVLVSPDGATVYVSGTADQQATSGFTTIAYDAISGTQVWIASYQAPNLVASYDCCTALTPDGSRLIVTGWSSNGTLQSAQFVTIAYDASTGSQAWAAKYRTPDGKSDYPRAIAVSPVGGRVFITGTSYYAAWETIAYRT